MAEDTNNIEDKQKDYEQHFRVALFGSARIKKDDKIHKDVYELSRLIAGANIDIVTGGGPGLMLAANQGHQDGQKNDEIHSYGLNIWLPNEPEGNRHLDIKMEFKWFSERLDRFMKLTNAVIVAPGGIGTLLELFYSWQLVQVKHICDIPIILLGDMWPGLIDWIRNNPLERGLIDPEDMNNIHLSKNYQEAFELILEYQKKYFNNEYVCPATCVYDNIEEE